MTWQVRPFSEATIPAPKRDEVLGMEPKLGAQFGFQCQDKTQGETKVLTSMLVKEGNWGLGSQWIGVFKGLVYCCEALLVELLLDASTGSDHWFICCDPVLKLCQRWFTKQMFFRVGAEPPAVIGFRLQRGWRWYRTRICLLTWSILIWRSSSFSLPCQSWFWSFQALYSLFQISAIWPVIQPISLFMGLQEMLLL
jgi:hypothetical protein